MSEKPKVFANGFSFARRESAPDWHIGRLSLKKVEAVQFIMSHGDSEWVNLNINRARGGNIYIELDTFEPKTQQESTPPKTSSPPPKPQPQEHAPKGDGEDDMPF